MLLGGMRGLVSGAAQHRDALSGLAWCHGGCSRAAAGDAARLGLQGGLEADGGAQPLHLAEHGQGVLNGHALDDCLGVTRDGVCLCLALALSQRDGHLKEGGRGHLARLQLDGSREDVGGARVGLRRQHLTQVDVLVGREDLVGDDLPAGTLAGDDVAARVLRQDLASRLELWKQKLVVLPLQDCLRGDDDAAWLV